MATIEQRVNPKTGKKAKFFTARWHDANGKSVGRTTKLSDPKKAQVFADEHEALAKMPFTQDHMAHSIHKLQTLVADSGKRTTLTLREYVLKDRRAREHEVKMSTYMAIKNHGDILLEFFATKAMADTALGHITRDHLIEFRKHLAGLYVVSTANNVLTYVRRLFGRAQEIDRVMHTNPAAELGNVKVSSVKPVVNQKRCNFTREEIATLFKVTTGEWKSMIVLGVWTGQRLGDLARLKWGAVDFENRMVKVLQGKTGKDCPVTLMPQPEEFLTRLRANTRPAPKPDDFIHPKLEALTRQNICENCSALSNQFAGLLVKAGLRKPVRYYLNRGLRKRENPGKTRRQNKLTFHSLRHTTATLLKEANVPVRAIGEILGHGSKEMTEMYLHDNAEHGREVMLKIAPFEAFETAA